MNLFVERQIFDVFPGLLYRVEEHFYDTVTATWSANIYFTGVGSGINGFWPADNTVLFFECDNVGNKTVYTYNTGGGTYPPVNNVAHFDESFLVITTAPSSDCCTINSSDFTVVKTNNTNSISPNGSISFTSLVFDVGDYEISIDGGVTWNSPPLSGLAGANYSVILKAIAGSCSLIYSVTIIDNFSTGGSGSDIAPLSIQLISTPDIFSPVFLPMEYKFQLINNTFTIKSDGRIYIEASTDVLKDFLSQLPYLRIINSANYDGVIKITDVDNPTTPTKFYFKGLDFVSDEVVTFIPIDRQVFQLFGETDFNVFTKIADISVAADITGVFEMRIEGFLQSIFEVNQPSNGNDLSLARKYYCIPRDYDLFLGSDETNPVLTAVFATVDISSYDDTLVPLGPSPINFIDPEGKGYPIIFSYLNQDNQRVSNVRSGEVNEIVSAGDSIFLQALPGNTYTIQWISPLSFTPYFSPSLPDWITVIASTDTSITIQIQTFTGGDVGDYGSADYSPLDYSIDQLNAIVGCYTFQMFDGAPGSDEEPIFTFTVCIFPTQLLQSICGPNLFNIAWVNQQGGWNSYIFKGQKKHGRDVSKVSTYKKLHELKKSSVEEVYDNVEVGFSMKSLTDLAFITMLRTSIQAYLFNEASQTWDIPIVIDKASFPVYQTPFRQGDQQGSFVFKYANEILIQRQ